MNRTPLVLRLLAAASFWATAAPAPAADLELSCQPLYAQRDFRAVRPDYVRAASPAYTWYLFDSRDLLHFRIELVNNAPQPAMLGELGWPENLELKVERDGEPLPAGAVRLELLRRTRLETRYFLAGKALEKVDFRRRANGWGSEPVQPHDDWQQVRTPVEKLPPELATYQQAGVEVALVAKDGAPLPPGVYLVDFRDPQTGRACEAAQQVVLRHPETELDRVDGKLARYGYLLAAGDPAAAEAELRRAAAENPGSLTAWYYLAGHAARQGDLELQLETLTRLRDLLAAPDAGRAADSTSVLTLAPAAVAQLERVREQAARARAGRPPEP